MGSSPLLSSPLLSSKISHAHWSWFKTKPWGATYNKQQTISCFQSLLITNQSSKEDMTWHTDAINSSPNSTNGPMHYKDDNQHITFNYLSVSATVKVKTAKKQQSQDARCGKPMFLVYNWNPTSNQQPEVFAGNQHNLPEFCEYLPKTATCFQVQTTCTCSNSLYHSNLHLPVNSAPKAVNCFQVFQSYYSSSQVCND